MRKIKIGMLVMMCIVTAFLCGILAYGITGHKIYGRFRAGNDNMVYTSMQLLLEKEVPLDGIDCITISYGMNSNDIYLHESEGNVLTIKEFSNAELNENELSTVTVSGSRITVTGKKRTRLCFNAPFSFGTPDGYTEVWMPSSYKGELSVETSSGDIRSDMEITLEKDLKASSTSGDITIPDVSASNVSFASSSGWVKAETINSGNNINIETTSGDIMLKQLTGTTDISSSSGWVKAEAVTGNTRITTTSGDIMVQRIDGDAGTESSSGNVKIEEGSGRRSSKTTSGDIRLYGVSEPWSVNSSSGTVWIKAQKGSGDIETTSGDVRMELVELTGQLDIHSSSGGVYINISEDNAFDFDADTSSGDINTFFDDELKFSKKGNNAQGTYGGNPQGKSIQIETTSGDVRIKKD